MPSESSTPAASATEPPFSTEELARLDKLIGKVKLGDRLGPRFELRNVYYTAPTDAVADFVRGGSSVDSATAIAMTTDNWAHTSTFVVADYVTNGFDYAPLTDGVVAIRVGDEFSRKPIPPFLLFPGGRVRPLRRVVARPLDAGSTLLDVESWRLAGMTDRWNPGKLWAIDIAEAEFFPVEGSHYGEVWQRGTGRRGEILSVKGFRRSTRTWHFDTSTDGGRSWSTAELDLPVSRKRWPYYITMSSSAVGPGHRQSVAMLKEYEDGPPALLELWQTDDERTFRRVPLPWVEPFVGGMAYTPDGSLLLAEVLGPEPGCRYAYSCDRPGRIWRMPPGATDFELAPGAPALLGNASMWGITVSGGMIIGRTGIQSVAVSRDGRRWTEVTPGR